MEHPDHSAAGFATPMPVATDHRLHPDVDGSEAVAGHIGHSRPADPDEQVHPQDEVDVPEPPNTGDEIVDAATADLAQAMQEPLELQVQAFERAHRTLQDRLADVES